MFVILPKNYFLCLFQQDLNILKLKFKVQNIFFFNFRAEWHDLFWLVHSVCLWDEKGPPKVYGALREVSFLKTIFRFKDYYY